MKRTDHFYNRIKKTRSSRRERRTCEVFVRELRVKINATTCLLFIFLLLNGLTLNAESPPLSLAACQRIAIDTNPLSRAACEGITIAKESAGIARAPYYPEVGFHAHYQRWQRHDFLRLNDPGGAVPPGILPDVIGPTNDYDFSIHSRYLLYDWGERRARLMAALAQQGAACEESEKIRQEILLNVAVAFYSLVANVELEKVAVENLERTESHHHLTEERHSVGDVPLADVYRAQVEVAQAKQGLVKAKNRVRISRANLNSAMGLPPNLEVAIEAPMHEPTSPQDSELHAAQSNSVCYRPELRKMQREIDALAFKVKEAEGACGPKFAAEGGYGKRDSDWFPQTEEWRVGVSMDVPIFTGFALTHNLRRARSQLCQARAQYDRIRLNVQQEVWTAYSRVVEAYETIEASIAQVRDAQESLRLTTERYKAGAGIVTDLLDAQTALTRAEATQVDALWSFQSAKATFLWTQGLLNLAQEFTELN